MYRIFNLYYRLYNCICGTHPHRRPWHSQWLAVKDIYRDLRRLLPTLEGQLLDIGCLNKPYAPWITRADKHIGIDVTPSTAVDHVIRGDEPWPLETGSIQSVLVHRQGGIGSTIGVLFLNWIHASMSRHLATHFLFVLLFPVWLPFCLFINMIGLLLDKLDGSGAFYHNVLLVMRKKAN